MSKNFCKKTGITRPVDDLGRIVLPKELRTSMGIREGDRLEIMVAGEHIVLAKAVPCCVIYGSTSDLIEVEGTSVCRPCAERLFARISGKLPSDRLGGDDMPRKSQYQRTDGYTGGQVWRVEYPGRDPLDILAPTWQEAAVTAAAAWGMRWQSAEYHQEVKCTPMGHRSQVAGGVVHG